MTRCDVFMHVLSQHGASPTRGRCVAIGAALVALGGCVSTVRAPSAPDDPRPVFLLVHSDSSSVVLSSRDGTLVRYAYGDWRWYAEGRTGLGSGIAALLWPTAAALGRRKLMGPATENNVLRRITVAIDEVHRLDVSGKAIDALQSELDAVFAAGRDTRHYRAERDLEFVPHPEAYTMRHNSNRVVVQWLNKLGCDAEGGHLLTRWRIVTP